MLSNNRLRKILVSAKTTHRLLILLLMGVLKYAREIETSEIVKNLSKSRY